MSEKEVRPSWDEYYIDMLNAVSKRATCDRGKNSAIIVKNKRILTTGYVGSPSGLPHCDDVGHLFKKHINDAGEESNHCVRTTHAEANAIATAARFGISVEGATIYTKMSPCLDCAKLLINSGVKRIVCKKLYHAGKTALNFLNDAGIEVSVVNNEVETYDKM